MPIILSPEAKQNQSFILYHIDPLFTSLNCNSSSSSRSMTILYFFRHFFTVGSLPANPTDTVIGLTGHTSLLIISILKIIRKILTTTLTSSLIFILMFCMTIVITNFMLNLKELSNQTIKVLSDWNALDRITNDVLYYRLDSVSRISQMEESWLKGTSELNDSFQALRANRLLNLLPEDISRSVNEAWHLWLFSKEKLEEGQKIFSRILNDSVANQKLLIEIDKTTFYEKLLFIISGEETYHDKQIYQSFLSHMYVLDITGESFSLLLKEINEKIPDEIEEYIFFLLFAVGLILILVIFVSLLSARKLTQPIIQIAESIRRMGDGDYPVSLTPSAEIDEEDELSIIQNGFNRMAVRIHALYDESLKKEKEKRTAQFRALQYQINPHFLYNTLGTLRMTAAVQGYQDMADNIHSLSRLLRNTISKSDSFILVSEEMDIMDDYINIIQIRYKNRLNVRFSISESILDLFIPALLLQPLLENAVLHGLSEKLNSEADSAELLIEGNLSTDQLVLSVFDNGRGIPRERAEKLLSLNVVAEKNGAVQIGLKNIHDRIQLLFGEGFGVGIQSESGVFTRVSMYLPIIREESDAEAFNR